MSWEEQAACRGCDPALWFPEEYGGTADARAVCRGCPVSRECDTYATESRERHGVWGGINRSVTRRRQAAQRAVMEAIWSGMTEPVAVVVPITRRRGRPPGNGTSTSDAARAKAAWRAANPDKAAAATRRADERRRRPALEGA